MKTKITGLLTFLIGTFFFYSCDTDVEALEFRAEDIRRAVF